MSDMLTSPAIFVYINFVLLQKAQKTQEILLRLKKIKVRKLGETLIGKSFGWYG